MTTIVYHHGDGQIAVDSRTTSGGVIDTDKADKVVRLNGCMYFLAAKLGDVPKFVDEHVNGHTGGLLDCSGFMIKEGKCYLVTREEDRYITVELTFSDARGSGADFALAAMDHGKSAKEAVKYAMTRDIYTGGRVRVFNVK